MSSPTPVVVMAPEPIAAVPAPEREPAPRSDLTNRAAGLLRARRRAEARAQALAQAEEEAPADVGFAETGVERSAQDDADLERASRAVAVPTPHIAPVPRRATPADTGLAGTRAERTTQDEAEARAAQQPLTVPERHLARRSGPDTSPIDPDETPDVGLTRTLVERTRQDESEAAAAPPGTPEPAPAPARPAAGSGLMLDPTAPTSAQDYRARTAAAAAALARPALGSPEAHRAPLEAARAGIAARGEARTDAARLPAAAVVGRSPVTGHGPPHEDLAPISAQLTAITDTSGIALPAAQLAPVTRSPRGTLPDVTGPVLSADQLRVLRLGDLAIAQLYDPTEREQMRALRQELTATTVATAPDAAAPAVPPVSAPITDEPVSGVELTPQQRAMFTQAVGELMRDPAGAAHSILASIRRGMAAYPSGVLDVEFPHLDEDEEERLTAAIGGQARVLGEAIHLAPDQIQAATEQRTAALEAQRQAATQATSDAAAATTHTVVRVATASQRTASTTAARASSAIQADARATSGRRISAVEARVERTVQAIRDRVSTGLAAYDTQQRNRERAIADAVRRQVAAYRFAQTRDEIALGSGPASADVRRWADAAVAALQDGPTSEQARLVADAQAETGRLQTGLSDAGGAAFTALHEWGARQSSANQAWWTELDTGLQSWAVDATARATQWQTRYGEQVRLSLTQDLAAVQHIVALQQANDQAGVRAYLATLDHETSAVVATLSGSGGPDLSAALAAGVHERVRSEAKPRIETRLTTLVDTMDVTPENRSHVENLVSAMQGGQSIYDRASDIHASVTRWRGFDEGKIFRALTGMTPLGSRLMRVVYQERFDQTLDEALRGEGHVGHLTDDEINTAHELMAGNLAAGGAGALRSAIEGLGTDLDEVRRVLRTLTPEQRTQALEIYRSRYGETLTASLSDEWISHSETEETTALAAGDLRGADAVVLGRAVVEMQDGGYPAEPGMAVPDRPTTVTIDRSGASAVYAGIRTEVEAEGTQRHWTTAQIEAEIALRNQETEAAFNSRYSDRSWARAEGAGPSALRTAFSHTSPGGQQLLNALADNDLTAADAARLRIEDEGVYAEDAAINAVLRDQHSRALAEVNRDLGPILSARVDAQMREREDREPYATEAQRRNARMALERKSAQTVNQIADERTRVRTDALGARYEQTAGRSLAAMVEDNMSGWSRREARAYVTGHGVLDDYQRIRYSIMGVGTDLPMLRQTLSTMSRAEIVAADERWRHDNHGESLLDAVQGDTSGRDEDDLTDMVNYGAPQTVEDQAAAVRRRFENDRRNETAPAWMVLVSPGLALTGGQTIGAALTGPEIASARREVERMEADLAQMHRTGLTRDEQRSAGAHFDLAMANASAAIEFQRNAVDAWANLLSTAAAIVAAVVVGLALAPFTAGGSGVVAAAVITSLVATGVSMMTKALIKGGAYGTEEIFTDVAVGAVDALASALTAGLAHALLGGVTQAALPAGREAVLQGAARIGRAGATSGARSGFGGFLSRFGSRGVLASAVEGRGGLLATLAAESSPMYQRLAARGAAHLIEQTVQTLPSQFAASMLDERTWREPGGPLMALRNTAEGTVHSLGMGVAIGGVTHLVTSTIAHFRPSAPEAHIPTDDVLSRMARPQERMADFRAWRAEHPEGTYPEFYREREARVVGEARASDADRSRVREGRREFLSGLEPAQRGAYNDVPILLAGDAEFREHGGGAGDQVHLLVEDGRAVLLLRDGAPPSALAGMLPTVQDRIFAHSGGLTLEGALPPHVRGDVTVRRVPTLTTDTVRVVPIPPTGPIRGLEVQVGPRARPVDVALHAGEVERVGGWTGRVGEARLLAARFATFVGFDVVSPLDRARFEAAGEVGKLGPVIEDRIRRWVAVSDSPVAAARVEAEIRDQIAQLDRARRILSGELVAEPRGFIATEGLSETAPVEPVPAAAPVDPLVELLRGRRDAARSASDLRAARNQLANAEARGPMQIPEADVRDRLHRLGRQVGPGRLDLTPLGADFDLSAGHAVKRLRRFMAAEGNRDYISDHFRAAVDRLDAARAQVGADRARLPAEIARLEVELAEARARVAQYESATKTFNGVEMSTGLPEPVAGWEYVVEPVRGDTPAQQMAQVRGYQTELRLANDIQTGRRQTVVRYGDRAGTHGSDVISVDATGNVFLWDSKYLGSGAEHAASETFTDPARRANAIEQAITAISRTDRLTPSAKAQAIANIRDGNFTAITISHDGRRFHHPVSQVYRGRRPVP